MKTLCVIIIFIVDVSITMSQSYKPVLDSDTVTWNYLSDRSCGDCLETLYLKAYGDTIFNDLHYRKLMFGVVGFNAVSGYDTKGFIREDTINGRLYLLNYAYDCTEEPCHENIVYDMGLRIGDTLAFKNSDDNIPMVVAEIDTIDDRKVISFLKNSDDELKFIEGIGPTREMLYNSYPAFTGFSELLCVTKNRDFNYTTFWGKVYGCSASVGLGLSSEEVSDIRINPNPVKLNHSIYIEHGKNHLVQVQIFNLSGRLLYTATAPETNVLPTDKFTRNPGMFILLIKSRNSDYSDRRMLLVF